MKIYIERKIESEKDLPHCLRGVKHYAHQRIGNIIYTDVAWTWRVNDIDWYLKPIEVDEGAEEILNKHHVYLAASDFAPKEFKDSIERAMKEYAAIQVAKALDKPTDEDIEEWAKEQFMSKKDYSHLTEIQEAILICFKSGCSYGAKAALNGEIKKEK